MTSELRNWVQGLRFWRKAFYLLIAGFILLSILGNFFHIEIGNDLYLYAFLFFMFGSIISFGIDTVVSEVSEKANLMRRVTELEEELRKYKGEP